MSAIDLHIQLQELVAERAQAVTAGAEAFAGLRELDDEIETTRHAYIGTAVTEIASLRAELSGPQRG
jgi:hypothetical protein